MISTFLVAPRLAHGPPHDRTIVDAEIGESAGEDRDAGRRLAGERVDGAGDLLVGEDRRHVHLHAIARERANGVDERLALVLVTGSLT